MYPCQGDYKKKDRFLKTKKKEIIDSLRLNGIYTTMYVIELKLAIEHLLSCYSW